MMEFEKADIKRFLRRQTQQESEHRQSFERQHSANLDRLGDRIQRIGRPR